MPSLTLEQRKAGGRASAEQIKQDRLELARLREWFNELSAKEALKQTAEQTATQPLDVVRVREKLDKLDEAMNAAQTDKEWDCFSRAYERMFRVWCILTKTPGPGNLKPSSPKQSRSLPPVQPVALPTPAEPAKG
jgi:hypothetical protein